MPRPLPELPWQRARPLRVICRIVTDACGACGGTTMWTKLTARCGDRGGLTEQPPEGCDHCGAATNLERRTAGILWAAAGRVVWVRGDPDAW